ncbi:GPW/gp25 family protein [Fulvivirga ulvae]|uniref:GPW/gp25 family protein n=1 Tax=Fulvivirga ulvae TaxID=2904245 RepID=UPI001F27846F|nr:GPW/gp25 family protein [Fulvivirga ulvae]UII31369.1 GPW/gp25 family protein [Fulvivirga ulvae]
MENKFLGKGWAFPPEFYAGGAEVEMVSGEEDIKQSLQIILSTSLNERTMNSGFGCELSRFVFEETSQRMIHDIRKTVANAILLNEPRIKTDEVQVLDTRLDEGIITISVNYLVRSTNNRFNLVYPFYLNEATI